MHGVIWEKEARNEHMFGDLPESHFKIANCFAIKLNFPRHTVS